ncbi:MAG: TRAP transporter substrate-binding protein [Neoaquamicrobium sediminum]|uniref:TRAP transporter substrate-binding protein n=1 Tax=Neoaquamicrobium sediminum TaxID=1849104 RepID=A0ABV3WVG9_9HYPH|nr:TRAP transporter substrate-binding protein [Mesorhizobium sediminum]NRC53984.1 TRAP transporter substrate-binding protein [Mesorhizobium sediminum]
MSEAAISRRRFLRNSTLGAGAAAAATTLAAPAVLAQAPVLLRMQSSWPSSDVFQEMAQQYVERVEMMSGGRLKIDLLPAGAVVGAFQVQDACHDGVLDAAHDVPVYWYGKNKAASLFGTGPVFGADATQMIAWMYHGGGNELYRELTQDILGLNVVGFFAFGMPAQPLGWFKNPIESADQLAGLKYRTVGLAADLFQAMGCAVAQLPGGEIVPAMERGVIDAFEFNNPTSDMRFGAQDVAKNYMLASYHQASESFEFIFNKDKFESLDDDLQAILKYAVESVHLSNTALAMDQYSSDLAKLQNESGVNVMRTPDDVLKAQLAAWDQILPPLMEDEFFAKVVESQKAWCERVVFYTLQNAPDYRLAYQHYFPGKI